MGWVKTIGIFLKGLFGYMNNPARWELKDKKWTLREQVHVKDAELDGLKKDNKIDKKKHKNEDKAQRRDDKDEFGRFPKIKKRKAMKTKKK